MFIAGLDLGQRTDYTCLLVAERRTGLLSRKPNFTVVYAKRWRGFSYVDVVDEVSMTLRSRPFHGDVSLRIDGTGVGVAVLDLFEEARGAGQLQVRELEPIVSSGGNEPNPKTNTVPKKNLIGSLEVAVSEKRLKLAGDLPLAPTIRQEMKVFQAGFTRTGRPQFEAAGGHHDDIVIALALITYARPPVLAFSVRDYNDEPELPEPPVVPFSGGGPTPQDFWGDDDSDDW